MSEADQVKLYAVSSFGRFVFRPAPVTGYLDIAFGGELLSIAVTLDLLNPVSWDAELLLIFLPVFIRP